MPSEPNLLDVARLTSDLRAQAELIRARLAHIAHLGEATRWHSSAAARFRSRLEEICAQLSRCAAAFDQAAVEIDQLTYPSRAR